MRMNRCSSAEWSGSAMVSDRESPKAVEASSKETPCFYWLEAAFSCSHSNSIRRRIRSGSDIPSKTWSG